MVTISVFTLNCWGIGMGVSRDRVVRFTAIAQHLATSDYDIVCLQEVWCPEDYETIRKITRYYDDINITVSSLYSGKFCPTVTSLITGSSGPGPASLPGLQY